MDGFDLNELLPFYLDETDEQISALNDALLTLEREPANEPVLREAFRMAPSIRGSSTVMGFTQVRELTHHLESFFDQLRSGQRVLDRAMLDLSFVVKSMVAPFRGPCSRVHSSATMRRQPSVTWSRPSLLRR